MTEILTASVKDALRQAGSEHGIDITFGGPDDPWRDEALHINLYVGSQSPNCFVSVSRHPTLDEGTEGTTHTFIAANAPLHPHEETKLRAFVAEGVRVQRRRDAVAPYSRSGIAPAWAYVMHRFALLVLSHAAGGRDLTFVPIADNMVKPNRKRSQPKPLITGQAMRLPLADFVGRYGRHVAEARADRVFVHDLEIGSRPDNSPLALFRDQAAPELLVTGLQLPQTTLVALPGTDLARVVDHPALGDHAGIPIVGAINDESVGGVLLRLPLILDPAGPSPAGVDVSWRQA